jgi:hypothetical protein
MYRLAEDIPDSPNDFRLVDSGKVIHPNEFIHVDMIGSEPQKPLGFVRLTEEGPKLKPPQSVSPSALIIESPRT